MTDSETLPGEYCTYGELVNSRKAFCEFIKYDFDPDVALKIARLARWAAVQFADYDKVRGMLEGRHAERDKDGAVVPAQKRVLKADGASELFDVPDTFVIPDPEAWARDDGMLSAGKLWVPAEDRITSDDMSKIRGRNGEGTGPANPEIIAGLGPFFVWPEAGWKHHSVADDIWKVIEGGQPAEPRDDAEAA